MTLPRLYTEFSSLQEEEDEEKKAFLPGKSHLKPRLVRCAATGINPSAGCEGGVVTFQQKD